MRKYESVSDNAEVIGQALSALMQSAQLDEFQDILRSYHLDDVAADQWYPHQLLLDFYWALSKTPNSAQNMVSIGVKVIETAKVPSNINSIETALAMLNGMIDLNMRHVGPERFEIERQGPSRLQIVDRTAFPHDLIYGYLFGIVQRFRGDGDNPTIQRTFLNPTDPDADGATYIIGW